MGRRFIEKAWPPVLAMAIIVAASNYLVQFPINDWLTWGAFTFPLAFLVNDLTNRFQGIRRARLVVACGFAVAALLSFWLAPWRIATASAGAFLISQLLDVQVFDRLRRTAWWLAPLVSTLLAAVIDTFIFFAGAFAGSGLPWHSWAVGDLAVKLAFALCLLVPYRVAISRFAPQPA